MWWAWIHIGPCECWEAGILISWLFYHDCSYETATLTVTRKNDPALVSANAPSTKGQAAPACETAQMTCGWLLIFQAIYHMVRCLDLDQQLTSLKVAAITHTGRGQGIIGVSETGSWISFRSLQPINVLEWSLKAAASSRVHTVFGMKNTAGVCRMNN